MARRFSKPLVDAVRQSRILGIRAGRLPHRFLGIWGVVVNDRVFVRPWNDKPDGWYRVMVAERVGVLQVGERNLKILARRAHGERLRDAVDAAYAEKYPTPGSRPYVRGFATPRRRETTLELLPG